MIILYILFKISLLFPLTLRSQEPTYRERNTKDTWDPKERTSYKEVWISGVCFDYFVHFSRAPRKKWDSRQELNSGSLANQEKKRSWQENTVCRGPRCNSVHCNLSDWQTFQMSPKWKARPYRYLLGRCNPNQTAQTGIPHRFL